MYRYGYCKQNQPATPASDSECLCLVSERNWHGFYPKVLDWLNQLRGSSRTRDDIGVVLAELFTERVLGDRLTLTFDSHPGLGVSGFRGLRTLHPWRPVCRVTVCTRLLF